MCYLMRKTLNFMHTKSIAIMGGTFDPIHYGHLVSAEAVRKEFNIDKIVFIPSGQPPHKEGTGVSEKRIRYAMAEIATLSNENFDVSTIEIDREGTTYTVDTIEEIKKICSPDTKIYFITGADAIEKIFTWKNAEKLLKMCEFIAVTRPGHDKKKLMKHISSIENECRINLHFLEIPALAISSTDIRQRVLSNKSIKYLLPEDVERYIYKYGLYKKIPIAKILDYNTIDTMLREDLSTKRYLHTMGTAEEAVKLAKVHGEDEDKAYIAALFHDCAKEIEDSQKLALCKEYGIKLDSIIKQQISLSHGFLGAEIAKKFFGVEDDEILDSIRYHTTGRKNMSKLEKIIYIADVIEPTRGYTEELKALRKIAYEDLDKTMIVCLQNTLKLTIEKKQMFHPRGIEALDYFERSKATKLNLKKIRKEEH